jgi:predicted O-methyltransferase YrrM
MLPKKVITLKILPDYLNQEAHCRYITTEQPLTPQHDVDIICKIVTALAPDNLLEIGTAFGHTTKAISLNMFNGHIYTIDLNDGKYPYCQNVGSISRELPNVTHINGDSRNFNFKPFFDKIDMVYIDGSHEKNNVIIDTYRALHLLNENGCIIWHDYNSPWNTDHVTEAVDMIHENIPGQIYHIEGSWLAYCILGEYEK